MKLDIKPNADYIKSSVLKGVTVIADGYGEIIRTFDGRYLIKAPNGYCIGLTQDDNKTLNAKQFHSDVLSEFTITGKRVKLDISFGKYGFSITGDIVETPEGFIFDADQECFERGKEDTHRNMRGLFYEEFQDQVDRYILEHAGFTPYLVGD